MAAITLVNKVR